MKRLCAGFVLAGLIVSVGGASVRAQDRMDLATVQGLLAWCNSAIEGEQTHCAGDPRRVQHDGIERLSSCTDEERRRGELGQALNMSNVFDTDRGSWHPGFQELGPEAPGSWGQ